VDDLVKDDAIVSLQSAAVLAMHAGRSAASGLRRTRMEVVNDRIGFKAQFGGGSDALKTVQLENSAWRWVHVKRQDLDNQGRQRGLRNAHGAVPAMGGAVGLSVGSLFTGTFGAPSAYLDHAELTQLPISSMRYWVMGPGFGAGDALPNGVDPNDQIMAWGLSIFMNLVIPFLDLWHGSHTLYGVITSGSEAIKLNIASFITGVGAAISHTFTAAMENDAIGVMRGVINVAIEIIAGIATWILQFGLLASVAADYIAIAGLAAACFGIGNLAIAIANWSQYPVVANLELPVAKGEVTVQ
jgi:hypothetical protein